MYTLSDKKLIMLRPKDIKPSSAVPRREFDEYELKLLTDSIQASGIIEPLAVRRLQGGGYALITGERRLRAALRAGLRRVPCIVHKTDEETAALYAVTENLQRSRLNAFEEAESINRLITEYGLSQSEAAARLGIAQSTLSNKLRLLRLSDGVQSRIISSGLSERYARALLRLPEERRQEALDRIIADELTLKQTEEYIFDLLNPEDEPCEASEEPIRKAAIGDARLFANSLAKLVTTLHSSGIEAVSKKYENDKYIEYRIRIPKAASAAERCRQLKIC